MSILQFYSSYFSKSLQDSSKSQQTITHSCTNCRDLAKQTNLNLHQKRPAITPRPWIPIDLSSAAEVVFVFRLGKGVPYFPEQTSNCPRVCSPPPFFGGIQPFSMCFPRVFPPQPLFFPVFFSPPRFVFCRFLTGPSL